MDDDDFDGLSDLAGLMPAWLVLVLIVVVIIGLAIYLA